MEFSCACSSHTEACSTSQIPAEIAANRDVYRLFI
jgi:hypothetical protein